MKGANLLAVPLAGCCALDRHRSGSPGCFVFESGLKEKGEMAGG